MTPLHVLTATALRRKIQSGEITAEQAARAALERIREADPEVRAFLTIFEKEAIAQAKSVDAKIKEGQSCGLLAGVPVAVKDNLAIQGQTTTCASKSLENFVAPYDAHVVERLKAEDAVIVGKTNLDEFAMGSSCEHSAFHPTLNPRDTTRIPGGSSGGSAAAVAAEMVPLALGSDTGGSVRQPAALCGVMGLKPTYGRVSRYGLVAFGSSLDQVGVFARTAEDSALGLAAIGGWDRRDSTSVDRPIGGLMPLEAGVAGLRIGVPKEYFAVDLDADVEAAVRATIAKLAALGVEVQEVSLPHTEYANATYQIIATAEASSNLARYDGVIYSARKEGENLSDLFARSRGYGLGTEVKRRIELGTYVLSAGYYDAYYLKASKVRRLIQKDFDQVFEKVDAVVCPTSPITAFRIGERLEDPLKMYACDVLTVSANLAGIPGISVPCGRDAAGLPVGLQILGPGFGEPELLRLAAAVEQT